MVRIIISLFKVTRLKQIARITNGNNKLLTCYYYIQTAAHYLFTPGATYLLTHKKKTKETKTKEKKRVN